MGNEVSNIRKSYQVEQPGLSVRLPADWPVVFYPYRMSLLRRLLLTLLLLLPLIGGAVYAAVAKIEPAATWSAEPAAAPGATDLVPARRAAGEAASQAGLLKGATGELTKGSGQLADGVGQLHEGSTAALTGANELSAGLVKLQAGTGQLGDGAVKVADGVAQAVDQVQSLALLQTQIIAEIDKADAELAPRWDPQSKELRNRLGEFRKQVDGFKLDGAMVDQLAALRSGSREIANQLAVPGNSYHDGIYTATKGSKELAAGLAELDKGLAEASTGAGGLRDGATKIDGMATNNKERIGSVQRALPADPEPTATVVPLLVPLLGFLIAAVVMVGASFSNRWRWLLAVALGAVLVLVLGTSLTPLVGAGLVGIVILAGLTAALFSNALVRLFGTRGRYAGYGFLLIQAGIVGWVWKQASGASVSSVWNVLAHLMPMHYATASLSALGNSGSHLILGVSCAVLAAIAALSGLVLKVVPVREP